LTLLSPIIIITQIIDQEVTNEIGRYIRIFLDSVIVGII